MVYAPTTSLTLSAGISGASGWTVNSEQIVVDDVPYPVSNPSAQAMFSWNCSAAANPSEHTLYATAQISRGAQTLSLDSRNPPPPPVGPYTGTYGDGRASDFVIADVQLKSLKFNGNIPLAQDAVTLVPSPEFTRTQGALYPAAYVQGKNANFTMTLCDSHGAALTGSATLGYALKLQANPNATNAGTGQPIPALTLYDNTTASPVAPTAMSGGTATVSASTALYSWVAKYSASFSPFGIYAEFTHVTPVPTWKQVATHPLGNTLYAVVATPTAPMATPWVPVLDDACHWATGATDATSATTALAKGLYDNGTYNGNVFYTDTPQDGEETFHLKNFLNNTSGAGNLTGDCRVFADFLCCLSNGIGAKPLQVQRSAAAADILPNKDGHCHFFTKNFVDAPWGPSVPGPNSWDYHEWACSDVVFDACMGTTSTPLVNLTEPNYQSAVVDYTLSPHFFQAQSAFTPTIVN